MNDIPLSEEAKNVLKELLEEVAKDCRKVLGELLGSAVSINDLPEMALSEERPCRDYSLSQDEVRAWARETRSGNLAGEGLPPDLVEAIEREREPKDGDVSFSPKESYSFTRRILGRYEESSRRIEIYYKNHPSYDEWGAMKAKEGGLDRFIVEVCFTAFHECFHHIHSRSLGGKGFCGSEIWEKEALSESLADYFAYACLREHVFQEGKTRIIEDEVAEARRESWRRFYGSPWPYAYALAIAKHQSPWKQFAAVFRASLTDWKEAYSLLMGGAKRDLVFCEFTSSKASSETPQRSHAPFGAFGFIVSPAIDETPKGKDVTSAIIEGRYSLGAPYTLLYLYDYRKDAESRRFIELYGGKIHNKVSAKVTVLTFFDRATAANWKNVQCRDQIVYQDEIEPSACERMVSSMKERFGVASLPSLVLIKKEGSYSAPISFSNLDAEGIYDGFADILQKIDDNCEEPFPELAKIIARGEASLKKGAWESLSDEYWTDGFLNVNQSRKGMTQLDLALDIGICERMLRYKIRANSFSREECLKLGIVFGLDKENLNELLCHNNNAPLRDSSLDLAVLEAIKKGMTIYEVEQVPYLKGRLFPSKKPYTRKEKE